MSMMFYQILICNFTAELYPPIPAATGISDTKVLMRIGLLQRSTAVYLTLVTFHITKLEIISLPQNFFVLKLFKQFLCTDFISTPTE